MSGGRRDGEPSDGHPPDGRRDPGPAAPPATEPVEARALTLALVADTHLPRGRRRIPEACLDLLRAADLIIHAGDITSVAVLEELEAFGPPVAAVLGNVDEPSLSERLPESLTLEVGGVSLGLVHDAGPARGRVARLRRRFPDAAAVVFGHSHIPLHERDGAFQIFNPGSPTERRRAPRHTMGVGTVKDDEISLEHVALD